MLSSTCISAGIGWQLPRFFIVYNPSYIQFWVYTHKVPDQYFVLNKLHDLQITIWSSHMQSHKSHKYVNMLFCLVINHEIFQA